MLFTSYCVFIYVIIIKKVHCDILTDMKWDCALNKISQHNYDIN